MKTMRMGMVLAAVALVSTEARADLVCLDARSQDGAGASYRPDELPEASATIYLALEACACGTPTWTGGPPPTFGACAPMCLTTDEDNDWVCGTSWPVDGDTWTSSQKDACEECIAVRCAAENLACNADGSP